MTVFLLAFECGEVEVGEIDLQDSILAAEVARLGDDAAGFGPTTAISFYGWRALLPVRGRSQQEHRDGLATVLVKSNSAPNERESTRSVFVVAIGKLQVEECGELRQRF